MRDLFIVWFSSLVGPGQDWQEGSEEEGRRPLHPQGLVRHQGPHNLQGSRCWKDLGQPHPGYQVGLRRSQRPRLRGLPRRSSKRDGKVLITTLLSTY